MRNMLLKAHRWLGLPAGLVLSLVGLSGALYAFEEELRVLVAEPVAAASDESARLSPPELLPRLKEAGVEEPTFFLWTANPWLPVWVNGAGQGEQMFDPYSGAAMPKATQAHHFFRALLDFHRTLMLGEPGRWIVGIASIILVVLAVTGVAFSFPKLRNWYRAFKIGDWNKLPIRWGRWHRALGWWFTPALAMTALTGLVWTFTGFRALLYIVTFSSAPEPPPEIQVSPGIEAAPIELLWASVDDYAAEARAMRLVAPGDSASLARFEWQPPYSPFTSARSVAWLHPQTGAVVRVDHVKDFSRGNWLYRSAYPLHTGRWGGWPAKLAMALVGLSLPFFTATGVWIYARRLLVRPTAPVRELSIFK